MPKETKTIWLVRHGLTVSNISNTIQGLDDPLTEEGIKQAKKLGERFIKIDFDLLLASDAIRAIGTAEQIAKFSNHNIQSSPLFRELSDPTELIGQMRTEPDAVVYLEAQRENNEDPDWKYRDEESYADLFARAEAAFMHILSHEEERIVVVTHGRFLKFLTAYAMFGDTLTPNIWNSMNGSMRTVNTGITLLKWNGEKWHLLAWNDHAHLGE